MGIRDNITTLARCQAAYDRMQPPEYWDTDDEEFIEWEEEDEEDI